MVLFGGGGKGGLIKGPWIGGGSGRSNKSLAVLLLIMFLMFRISKDVEMKIGAEMGGEACGSAVCGRRVGGMGDVDGVRYGVAVACETLDASLEADDGGGGGRGGNGRSSGANHAGVTDPDIDGGTYVFCDRCSGTAIVGSEESSSNAACRACASSSTPDPLAAYTVISCECADVFERLRECDAFDDEMLEMSSESPGAASLYEELELEELEKSVSKYRSSSVIGRRCWAWNV